MTKHEDAFKHAAANAKAWFASIEEMLGALAKAEEADDSRAQDDARETIEQSVLSVMVRDGWRQPGSQTDEGPEEYEILLSTGGPALRIFGRLDKYNQPETAELQMQDWGTPWTRHDAPEATLISFASSFYFGE